MVKTLEALLWKMLKNFKLLFIMELSMVQFEFWTTEQEDVMKKMYPLPLLYQVSR